MEHINVAWKPSGVFTVDVIRGARRLPVGFDAYLSSVYAEAGQNGPEAVRHAYRKHGGVHEEHDVFHNRFVNNGVLKIASFLSGGAPTPPTLMQLGKGGNPAAAFDRTLNSVVTPLAGNGLLVSGLGEAAFTASLVNGPGGIANDSLRAYHAFTCSANGVYDSAGNGPDEVCLRSAAFAGVCYAPFSFGEKLLGNTDVIQVTYDLQIIP